MLSLPEKIVFLTASLIALYFTYKIINRITRIIQRGQGEIDWSLARKRIAGVLGKTISLRPTFRIRIVP
ncbi:MAG: hypothetical protein U9R58_08480, partial [Chloroflexota bacterium]|nr:hypothetical protein [Chloroflexota bacterium]